MTRGGTRLAALVVLVLLGACSTEHAPAGPRAECHPFQFRACETDLCRGVQQCVDPGYWSDCDCVIGDAGYPDTGQDAVSDGADGESGLD